MWWKLNDTSVVWTKKSLVAEAFGSTLNSESTMAKTLNKRCIFSFELRLGLWLHPQRTPHKWVELWTLKIPSRIEFYKMEKNLFFFFVKYLYPMGSIVFNERVHHFTTESQSCANSSVTEKLGFTPSYTPWNVPKKWKSSKRPFSRRKTFVGFFRDC